MLIFLFCNWVTVLPTLWDTVHEICSPEKFHIFLNFIAYASLYPRRQVFCHVTFGTLFEIIVFNIRNEFQRLTVATLPMTSFPTGIKWTSKIRLAWQCSFTGRVHSLGIVSFLDASQKNLLSAWCLQTTLIHYDMLLMGPWKTSYTVNCV